MHHNSEPEAVDLLLEVDSIPGISEHVDDKNADRTCRYLVAVSAYLAFPDNGAALSAAYDSYLKVGKVHDAMRVALSMNDRGRAERVFIASEDELDKQQLGYLLARQGVMLDCEEGPCTIEDEDLREKVCSADPIDCSSSSKRVSVRQQVGLGVLSAVGARSCLPVHLCCHIPASTCIPRIT